MCSQVKGWRDAQASLWLKRPKVQHRGLLFSEDWAGLRLPLLADPLGCPNTHRTQYSTFWGLQAGARDSGEWVIQLVQLKHKWKWILYVKHLHYFPSSFLWIRQGYSNLPVHTFTVCVKRNVFAKRTVVKISCFFSSLPAPEIQVRKSLSWGRAASPKQNVKISW